MPVKVVAISSTVPATSVRETSPTTGATSLSIIATLDSVIKPIAHVPVTPVISNIISSVLSTSTSSIIV